MPEITAEQLETVAKIHRFCIEMGHYERFSVDLPLAEWDHIIACLREHEERAAREQQLYWESNFDGTYHYLKNGQVLGSISWKRHTEEWEWRIGGGKWLTESSRATAKSAVEKAVRNG